MPFFRKKPVVIEAVQLPPAPGCEVAITHVSDWVRIAKWCGGKTTVSKFGEAILIDTSEGQMRANPGDWIIRGVKGEFYPCKPDIFAATYEEATKEDLDAIGMRPAINLEPTLADMARTARNLGCRDESAFVAAVLTAMGGKMNPALLRKAWEEAHG